MGAGLTRWAASGLMALTGRADGPALTGPAPIADRLADLGELLAVLSDGRIAVDAPALCGERAALLGLGRRGRTSPGGACRLVRAVDGWLAVNLPRPDDVALLPAWLGVDDADGWESVVAGREVAWLDGRAALLGLPVGVPGSVSPAPLVRRPRRPGRARRSGGFTVVDLTSMWAGPLCASLLGLAGGDVVKVESPGRPDGARLGPRALYDLLHAGHRSVAVDLGGPDLLRLLRSADVVLESSRPRALEQLGIDREVIAAETGCVWVAVTGRGLDSPDANRPSFGDDAAVAGGLVATDPDDGGPLFCGDALADPVTGMVAAAGALAARAAGGPWIVDAGLAPCAAALASGLRLDVERSGAIAAPPRARTPWATAAPMGAHNDEVLAGAA